MIRKALSVLLAAAVALLLAEVSVRLLGTWFGVDPARVQWLREYPLSGRHEFVREHPYLAFVRADEFGQSDPPLPTGWAFEREKRPGVARIACLGASTTVSGYPGMLRTFLNERVSLEREYEVMNWGVSGWTTTESMLNYFLCVQDYEPDIVIVQHTMNDVDARIYGGFRSDYSHYRRAWNGAVFSPLQSFLGRSSNIYAGLLLRYHPGLREDLRLFVNRARSDGTGLGGDPLTPGTERPFLRNLETICENVRLRGGVPVLATAPFSLDPALEDGPPQVFIDGVIEHNQLIRDLAAEGDYLLVDLEAWARADPQISTSFFRDFAHMIPEGIGLKAAVIGHELVEAGVVR